MRHTDGELVWAGTNSNQHTFALNDDGARYLIDRWAGDWVISYLPFGTADKGRTPVPWLPGRRSMTTAKQAAAAHYRALTQS